MGLFGGSFWPHFSGAAVRPLGGTQVFAVFCTAHPAAGPLCAVSLLKKLNSFLNSFLEGTLSCKSRPIASPFGVNHLGQGRTIVNSVEIKRTVDY